MAFNNDILYNAAYAGFLEATFFGRFSQSQTATDYLKATQCAQAFATRVDSKIATASAISDVGGAAKAPATSAIITAEIVYTQLMKGLCAAIIAERVFTSTTAADYDDIADTIAAQFTEALLLVEA